MIWWIWTVWPFIHVFDVNSAWRDDDPDVAWLGEGSWTHRRDHMGIGLR